MGQPARVESEGQRAESAKNAAPGGERNSAAQSEIHAQMDAFRSKIKQQALLDKDFAAPDAKSQRKLDDLHDSINRTVNSLTDKELANAQKMAHIVNEEKKAHHGHSDTLDALRKQQESHNKDIHQVGFYNAVVLGAAAEVGSHVNENKYFPSGGGKVKSNELPKPPFNNPKDAEKYYERHPLVLPPII